LVLAEGRARRSFFVLARTFLRRVLVLVLVLETTENDHEDEHEDETSENENENIHEHGTRALARSQPTG